MHLLAAVCKRYGIDVHAYCLMGNHLHLVVYCPSPALSDAMRDAKSRYAKHYNQRHRGTGPVFEAPFVEVPILDDDHLLIEVRYAHRNPLDLDPNACLASYPWSSHGIYLGLRPQPHFLVTHVVHELFGPDYQRIVEEPLPHDKVQNLVRPIVRSPGERTIGQGEDWSLAGIRQEVASAAEVELVEVRTRSHNGLCGLAVVLALDVAGFTYGEIADPYGYNSADAVRMTAKRTRRRLTTDDELRHVRDLVMRRLPTAA